MDDQDRVSQASSVATISYFPVTKESDGKVQTFGKRCQAAKRDPNCPVVIRGWLNKKDSSGLKLWKRRWFVLSNYCLYYYKDSREESVLGSIPLPSYKILFCTPRECKNRKFTFKVVHQGMRSYFFSADTQEDMLGWVRALSQSAAMEPDSTMNRRCSSYQDFTQIGGSSESVEFPRSRTEEESPSSKHRHVSRTLSEPSHLSGGRMGRSHSEQRGRRSQQNRNRSPSNRTPSPPDFSRRRSAGPHKENSSLPGENAPTQAEMIGAGSLNSRGQLGSRPHTPVGRVDIRPHDEPMMVPQTLYYAPASPKPEFKSAPTTPVTERWQSMSKPIPIYGSVHHTPSGRRPLGKSHSTGADLLPPLPPSSRAAHASHPPQHHHDRSHVSVCLLPPAMASKPDPRELPPLRPLESDADAVLTRLCGCDKLLQSLSVELGQLQMDKDSVQCALEVSRLQVEEWKNQGPRALEEALTQKALLQEELVTIRARMCDVSLEMERVWSQYERMESELTVIRSHLQHICNFGMPQEQSQAQRELWMMEDILAGLRANRDQYCFLLGLQRYHMFQSPAPHPGSPGSPTERLQSGFPVDMEQEPPVRPPLPLELENHQSRDTGPSWTESPYDGIYCHVVDPGNRPGNSQPDLLNVKAQRDAPGRYSGAKQNMKKEPIIQESQSASKWIPPDTANQSTKPNPNSLIPPSSSQLGHVAIPAVDKRGKQRFMSKDDSSVLSLETYHLPPFLFQRMKMKMSEEEQIERIKRNQERLTSKRKPPLPTEGAQSQSSDMKEEAPFPLRVTRVVTAVLPSSLVARRVSVEDPPSELNTPLPEQILPEMQETLSEEGRTFLSKPPRRLLLESQDPTQEESNKRRSKQEHQVGLRVSRVEPLSVAEGAEDSSNQVQDITDSGDGHGSSNAGEQSHGSLAPDTDPDHSLTPEQRDAKLRRVERIRERVMRSAVRENAALYSQLPVRGKGKEIHQVPPDAVKKQRKAGPEDYGSCPDTLRTPAEHRLSSSTSQDEDEAHQHDKLNSQARFENRTQHSRRAAAARTKAKHPASPHHISSMTVYQKDGGKGFTSCKNAEHKKFEEPPTADENDFNPSDLRAKWFLSTNQWQGFIPLQIPAFENLYSEETEGIDSQPMSADDFNDFNEMSSTVSESLEKMKDNHSFFYKIACDISISDSDISKNDAQTSSKLPEEEMQLISESLPTSIVETPSDLKSSDPMQHSSDENDLTSAKPLPDSTAENQDAVLKFLENPACNVENMTEQKSEDRIMHEAELKVIKTDSEARVSANDSDQMLDKSPKMREELSGLKEMGNMKVDQERSEEQKKCTSLNKMSGENNQEKDNKRLSSLSNSPSEGSGLIRSASFGKPRVTVIKTSL